MCGQSIISISREYGSGGHEIAARIAKEYGLTLYDRNILDKVFHKKNMDVKSLRSHDEKPRNVLTSRSVRGFSNSIAENVAQMQFDFIKEKADAGESFVIVGRCSEVFLADYDSLISVFITGELEARVNRVMNIFGISEKEALSKINRHDKSRRQYHNSYSSFRWGDMRNYDVCINSTPLGIDGTVKAIKTVVDLILESRENHQ